MQNKEEEVPAGTVVSTKIHSWVIEKVLGRGGFGCVYLVKDKNDPTIVGAMKVEKLNTPKYRARLSQEAKALTVMRTVWQPHLLWAMDAGITPKYKFKFLVLPLVGRSLDWFVDNFQEKETFSPSTALKIVTQMMMAIRNLHEIGFLHRDIKPANFAIGYRNKEMIHMLDYGSARYFRGTDGFLARPRVIKKFLGTMAYASRAMHNQRESSRADDVEQWFFTLFEIFGRKDCMPWFNKQNGNNEQDVNKKKEAEKKKEEEKKNEQEKDKKKKESEIHEVVLDGHVRPKGRFSNHVELKNKKRMFFKKGPHTKGAWDGMPQCAYLMAPYIKKLDYYSRPDYSYILMLLSEADTIEHYGSLDESFDWNKPELMAKFEKNAQIAKKKKEQMEKEMMMLY